MNMLEDGIQSMITTVLAKAGADYPYTNATSTNSVRFLRRPQFPQMIDNGAGLLTEILITDFLTDPALLPGEPQRGDTIQVGSEIYTVQSLANDKVYRQLADGMIRIHTKRTT